MLGRQPLRHQVPPFHMPTFNWIKTESRFNRLEGTQTALLSLALPNQEQACVDSPIGPDFEGTDG